jgi:2-keto-4-pentenoate hydratase/2-oxohepta-3-ene-1,7-dioic acid hydratase in catechol pathway
MRIEFNGKTIDLKPTKIVAVAKNYRAHAAEMGGTAPEEPKFFLKPISAMIPHQGKVVLPKLSNRVDWEVELAVVIANRLTKASPDEVMRNILGYTVTVDITARDIQNDAKKQGMPWTIAKGFDTFAPLGPVIIAPDKVNPNNLELWLKQNGAFRQRGNTRDMVHPVDKLLSYISGIMTLEPMDIVATGTPEGIGSMKNGDFIEAGIDGIGVLTFMVENEK